MNTSKPLKSTKLAATVLCFSINLMAQSSFADQPTTNTPSSSYSPPPYEEKRYNFPFVHIDVKRHADGTKDVDVRAPFTKVHNPAGGDNAQVSAPFYKQGYPAQNGYPPPKPPKKSKTPPQSTQSQPQTQY